jgi:hypothetical protein
MDVPKGPPNGPARPGDLLDLPTAPAIPKPVSPTAADSDADSSLHLAMEGVEFGVRAVDQAALEREIATKVVSLWAVPYTTMSNSNLFAVG